MGESFSFEDAAENPHAETFKNLNELEGAETLRTEENHWLPESDKEKEFFGTLQ
jgi:hypothetical protein